MTKQIHEGGYDLMNTVEIDRFYTIEYPVDIAQEGKILEVSFQVPMDTDAISVKMEVVDVSENHSTVDLGVRDASRVRGWSGGARREILIGKDQATPGYIKGEVAPGEWAVLLGAYQIQEGCKVLLTIRCEKETAEWLKGDLHGHSVHSDGRYTLPEIMNLTENTGLDFIALTDHNTVSQNFSYPRESNVIFIPGMELTSYRGHCNVFGVEDPMDDFRTLDRNMLEARIRSAREKGAYISINHPHDFGCPSCSWQWGWDIDYDWVEVWNGPWKPSNQLTLEWWQEQLVTGKRLVVVGGSDTHGPHPYVKHGMPTTWVYTQSRNSNAILEAIHKGHVFLSYSPTGPFIEFTCGNAMMGETVPPEQRKNLELKVKEVWEGDQIKIISNRGVEEEFRIEKDISEFVHSWIATNQPFYRVEIWRYFDDVDQMLMAAMSNPIYFH